MLKLSSQAPKHRSMHDALTCAPHPLRRTRARHAARLAAVLGAALAAAAAATPAGAAVPGGNGNDTGTVPPHAVPQRAPRHSARVNQVSARSATLGPRVLAQGASGEDVAVLQDWLTRRGFRVPSTGYFGPVTQGEVAAFQTARGLQPDGVVGPRTLTAIGLREPLLSWGLRTDSRRFGWLRVIPGSGGIRVDARIMRDVEALIFRYDLRITAGYAPGGHATYGEHPLGLAIDAVPADGNWARAAQLAAAFRWRSDCGSTGCSGQLADPFRFIGYNGYPGHGDPAHAGGNAHIHLSWMHSSTAPNTRARWIVRFRAP